MPGPIAFVAVVISLALVPPVRASGQTASGASHALHDLLTSARTGDLPGIARALAIVASVDAADPHFQQTALMRAAMFGQAAAVAALLKARASTAQSSNLQRTALHWAAIGGSAEAVRLLVNAGARVDAADADAETPLGLAMGAGHLAATEALLTAGADASRAARSVASHLGLVLGNRVTGGRRDALRAVIRRGRGLENDDGAGRTALLVAASWAHQDGSADLARDLLAAGARQDARAPEGQTALEEVRVRRSRETDPVFVANLDRMLQVLSPGGRP